MNRHGVLETRAREGPTKFLVDTLSWKEVPRAARSKLKAKCTTLSRTDTFLERCVVTSRLEGLEWAEGEEIDAVASGRSPESSAEQIEG